MLLAVIALAVALVATLAALIRTRARQTDAITASERASRELRSRLDSAESQRTAFLEIMNGMGEGFLAIDRQRRVVLANRRFLDMFNISGDVSGRSLGEVIRVAAVFTAFDVALEGGKSSERFPAPFGVAERKIEMRAFPLSSPDIAAVALFIDVTQLERLEVIRRNFISDFSHEVRTPLAGLRSAVESYETAAGHITADEDQQLRRIMTRQLTRLERLVDDLSELSRIESGDLTLDATEVDLRRLIEDLCEDFKDRAAQKDVRFVISGNAARVRGDAMRLQQAFSNLIDNAIKYGATGSTVDISVEETSDGGIARIVDHGEGIAPEERDRIFRRFYRIDKSRSQEIAGAGLGLAITKHLILLHRGSIDVQSEPGKGSTFIVTLPRR